MSLLNCIGKVPEKVVAIELLSYFIKFAELHLEQMRARNQQYAIDAIASLVYKIQKYWAERKIAAILFIDVKKTFDHVSKNRLVERIMVMGKDRDFIKEKKIFPTDQII